MVKTTLGGKATNPDAIKIGIEAPFPPYVNLDSSRNKLSGFDIELMDAIADATGMDVSFFNLETDQLLAAVSQCKVDLGISALTRTDEFNLYLLFSDPYYTVGQVVVVKNGNLTITGRDSLSGMTVGVVAGFPGTPDTLKIPAINLITYTTSGLAFQDLTLGYVDAIVSDLPHALSYVNIKANNLKIVGDEFSSVDYGIAICKQRPDLATKINAGIAAVKANGTLDKLAKKWDLQNDQ